MATNITLHSDRVTSPKTKIIHDQELDKYTISNIKDAITSTLHNFQSAFCGDQGCSIPEKINVYSFDAKSDYDSYLAGKNSSYVKKAEHFTILENENEFDICFYLDRASDYAYSSLKRGIAHILIESNDHWKQMLPTTIKTGMADYVAGLEKDYKINNKGDDNRDFGEIKEDSLTLSTILTKGNYYDCIAEQAIKFLELKHGEDLDQLLQDLNTVSTRKEGREKVSKFIKNLQDYNSEFSEWIDKQPIQDDSPVMKFTPSVILDQSQIEVLPFSDEFLG